MPATIYLDSLDELQDLYDGVAEDFADIEYRPFLEGELDKIANLEREYFDRQVSPDGAAWAANAPRTIEQKGHDKVLRGVRGGIRKSARKNHGAKLARRFRQFRLSNSLTLKSKSSTGDAIREATDTTNGGWLAFGTEVEYSAFHDQGNSRVPARPHVGVNDRYLDAATERCADYTLKKLVEA